MTGPRRVELTVPQSLEGVRVDRAVSLLTDRSRTAATQALSRGGVRLDGAVVHRGSRPLRAGERLVVDAPVAGDQASPPVADDAVAVPVVHADADVIVVDKPAGTVVHPGAGHRTGTLVHGLLARFPDLADLARRPGSDPERPGIVHRLDRGTSGLLVVARSAPAYDSLVAQLSARRMHRLYRALVHGAPDATRGVVDAPVGRSTRDPTRMAVNRRGRPSRTHYELERPFDGPPPSALLRVWLETGRTHQIRVHMAAIGHPVVGDDLYGRGRRWPVAGLPPGRPFLHAAELGFEHPATAAPMSFSSPLPDDLEGHLARLAG